jgi:agmatinase
MMDDKDFVPFGGDEIQTPDVDHARVVVLPVCYENKPSYGTGSATGPYHILNASLHLERMDEEALVDWGLRKIHTAAPLCPSNDPAQAVRQIQQAAESVLKHNKFLLSLGGDHAVSIGPIKAASDRYPDIGVLQIDAHFDLRDEWQGSRYNHACVMRRVVEDAQVKVVPVGVRAIDPEEADFLSQRNISPFYAHEIDPWDYTWIDRIVDALPTKVYLTIDLDGLDPSVIPGTGTPEPGGLSYRQLVELIKMVGLKKKVVAADITELAKIEGTQVSEFTAAKIATKIIVYCL